MRELDPRIHDDFQHVKAWREAMNAALPHALPGQARP
jgi:hypothetical protein